MKLQGVDIDQGTAKLLLSALKPFEDWRVCISPEFAAYAIREQGNLRAFYELLKVGLTMAAYEAPAPTPAEFAESLTRIR